MMVAISELKEQLEQHDAEIKQLKASNEAQGSQRLLQRLLLQHMYDQLQHINQKLLKNSETQVCSYMYIASYS